MLPPLSLPIPSCFPNDWPLCQALSGRIPAATRKCDPTLEQHVRTTSSAVSVFAFPQLHSPNPVGKGSVGVIEIAPQPGDSFEELTASDYKPVRSSGCEEDWSSCRSLLHVNRTDSSSGGDRNLATHRAASASGNRQIGSSSAAVISETFQQASDSREGSEDDKDVDMHTSGFQDHAFDWQLTAAAVGLSGPSSSVSPFLNQAKCEPRDLENSPGGGDLSAVTMSNLTSASGEASVSSGDRRNDGPGDNQLATQTISNSVAAAKKKRNLPGTPDPNAEVIALSPHTLLATNRFVCEICNKGFQRDQNLQLHRRGHNLPWKLRQRSSKEIRKRVYICPEPSCVHHDAARALGDLTGIKKHFCRKHGEKKWKCDKCSKRYAVQSDWKAHMKTCGTREYRCDCGTLFSRRDSFITHRAFCDALADENARASGHRHGDGTQTDLTGSSDQVSLAFLGASSSSHGSMSQLSGCPGGSLVSSAASRPAMHNKIAGLAFGDGGMASMASRWNPNGMGQRSCAALPSTSPKLCLWLGTGPGPGQPASFHQLMSEGGNSHTQPSMNQADSSLSYLLQPPIGPQNALPTNGIRGSSEFNLSNASKLSTEMMHLPPSSTSFFTSDNGMSGLQYAMAAGNVNHTEGVAAGAGLSQLPSPGSVSNLSRAAAAYAQEQQFGATAQMSATALLQKAAMMGATASNASVFRNFGMGAEDSSSMILGGAVQQALHKEQGRATGSTSLLPTSMPTYSSRMRSAPGEFPTVIQGFADSLQSSTSPGLPSNGNPAVHDIMNSLAGSAGLFTTGMNNLPSSAMSGMLLPNDHRFLRHQNSMPERGMLSHASLLCGGPQSPSPARSLACNLGGSLTREDGDHKPTLDFLGVGGASGVVGQALSHRDLASIMSMSVGMEFLSSGDHKTSLMPEDGSRNPREKSWDSS